MHWSFSFLFKLHPLHCYWYSFPFLSYPEYVGKSRLRSIKYSVYLHTLNGLVWTLIVCWAVIVVYCVSCVRIFCICCVRLDPTPFFAQSFLGRQILSCVFLFLFFLATSCSTRFHVQELLQLCYESLLAYFGQHELLLAHKGSHKAFDGCIIRALSKFYYLCYNIFLHPSSSGTKQIVSKYDKKSFDSQNSVVQAVTAMFKRVFASLLQSR